VIFTRTHTNHNLGGFSPELTLTITWRDFHSKLTLTITWGDFLSELTLTIMSVDFHPNSQPTIRSGDSHLGTTWPPLLFRWKSPGVSFPGVWVIFAENLKVINANKCSPSLAREPRFVLFWWWTGSTALSGLKVFALNKMFWPFTTSARATRSKSLLAKPKF